MAAALFTARLAEARPRVSAHVHSAGMLFDGRPATENGVAVMAARGLDTSGHRSRILTRDMLRTADLVVGMAREHVREVVDCWPGAWSRTFTLKELVRRGEALGARKDGQPLAEWLAAIHVGRSLSDLIGESEADDVADPINQPRSAYERTATELDDLTRRLARLVVGNHSGRR